MFTVFGMFIYHQNSYWNIIPNAKVLDLKRHLSLRAPLFWVELANNPTCPSATRNVRMQQDGTTLEGKRKPSPGTTSVCSHSILPFPPPRTTGTKFSLFINYAIRSSLLSIRSRLRQGWACRWASYSNCGWCYSKLSCCWFRDAHACLYQGYHNGKQFTAIQR